MIEERNDKACAVATITATEECLQAIQSLQESFKPNWTGDQLLKYYEERELTLEQARAMYEHLQAEGLNYLETHPEEAEKFLLEGEMSSCPSTKTLLAIMDQLHPEFQPCPIEKLLARLEKITGSKFKAESWGSVWIDNKHAGIYVFAIERLWKSILLFNHDPDEAMDIVERIVAKALGFTNRPWWQFWV